MTNVIDAVAPTVPTHDEIPLPLKVTVDAAALKAALAQLKPAVLSRSGQGLPILGGVLIETTRHAMTLTTTDLDLTIEVRLPATTLRSARGVLPFTDVKKAADTFAKGPMEIEVLDADRTTAELRYENQVLEVQAWPAPEFPTTKLADDEGRVIVLDTNALAEVLTAASNDGTRPILTGVCIEAGTYVATDSYRLAAIETTAATGEAFLLPKNAAQILAKHQGRVMARIGARDIAIDVDHNVTVYSRLIEGEFPRWRTLIGTTRDGGITLTATFLADLKKVIKLGPKSSSSPVVLQPTDDGTGILLSISENGKGAQVTTPGFAKCRIAFTPAYLLATVTGTTSTTMHIIEGLKPALIVEDALEYGPACTRIRLAMPVRVS